MDIPYIILALLIIASVLIGIGIGCLTSVGIGFIAVGSLVFSAIIFAYSLIYYRVIRFV